MRTALLLSALALLGGCHALTVELPARLFGPPKVTPHEAHDEQGGRFDHAELDALLRDVVDGRGHVRYGQLDAAALDRYLSRLAAAPYEGLSRDEKLALLINAYNAFTLRLILDHRPLASIKDIPDDHRWAARRWRLAGKAYSLEDIEHGLLRAQFAEPRVHFALNCASAGCPPLRAEAYDGRRIEAQLAAQTALVHQDPRWIRFTPGGALQLTRLYLWYGSDFEAAADTVTRFVARHHPGVAAALAQGKPPEVEWLEYDWSLNRSR